jgi:anaerobic ribonucleoside-triphosphate reductase activating protein
MLRIHAFEPFSWANGPGLRAVVWVQGCSLGCPGCFNPGTHPFSGGEPVAAAALADRIAALADKVEGLTISGGEPLQQRAGLLELLRRVRRQTALSVLVFTGFTWEEVQAMPEADGLLACMDVLIAGRYDPGQRLARDLRGSANKTVHFLTNRYGPADLLGQPEAEIILGPAGQLRVSGMDPPVW